MCVRIISGNTILPDLIAVNRELTDSSLFKKTVYWIKNLLVMIIDNSEQFTERLDGGWNGNKGSAG